MHPNLLLATTTPDLSSALNLQLPLQGLLGGSEVG